MIDMDNVVKFNESLSNLQDSFYQKSLDALVSTMNRFHISDRCYSLLSIRDESTCLVNEDDMWKVFFSEQGLRTNMKTFSDIDEACECMFYEMSDNISEYEEMQIFYRIELEKCLSEKKI